MNKILLAIAVFFAFISVSFAAVNLNTATKDELTSIKGVGPAKAQAIISYRQKNGQFKSVDDLKNVKGFGDKSVDKIRAAVSVSGETTLPAKVEPKPGKKVAKADKK